MIFSYVASALPHRSNTEACLQLEHEWNRTKGNLRGNLLLSMAFGFSLSLLQLGLPLFSMQIFDRVLPSGQLPTLVALAGIIVFVTIVSTLIDASRSLLMVRSSQRACKNLDEAAVKASFGDMRSLQLLTDLDNVRSFVAGPVAIALLDAPWSLFYVLVLSLVNVWLGVYTLAASGIVVGLSMGGNYLLSSGRKENWRLDAHLSEILNIGSEDRQTIVAIGILPGLLARLRVLRLSKFHAHHTLYEKQAWIDAIGRAVRTVLQIGILTLAAMLTVFHDTNAGAIVASSMLFTRSIAPIERLSGGMNSLRSAIASWANFNAFVRDNKSELPKLSLPKVRGSVSVRNVSVITKNRREPALDNISLEVEAGLLYVIVGGEAAGKSTLAKLLCGGVTASTGSVRLDNMDFGNYNYLDLATQVGYLPEAQTSLTGTISSLISREGPVLDSQVIEAARLAGIDDLVRSLPHGYQTEVGSRTGLLSAGQMKRLALARAIYREPSLLVLDEPLIGLDESGEGCVLAIIKKFKDIGSTVIVVAKSPRLLHLADKLLFLEKGRLMMSLGSNELHSFVGPRSVVS